MVPRSGGFQLNTLTCLQPHWDSPLSPYPWVPEGNLPLGQQAGKREGCSQGLVIPLDRLLLFGWPTCCFSPWKCPRTRGAWWVPAAPRAQVGRRGDRGRSWRTWREGLHHPVPQDSSCLFPPLILQPLTQLTWRLQHPGDTPIPRGKHPHSAWLTPQQQNQSPAQGMEETVLQVGGF